MTNYETNPTVEQFEHEVQARVTTNTQARDFKNSNPMYTLLRQQSEFGDITPVRLESIPVFERAINLGLIMYVGDNRAVLTQAGHDWLAADFEV